MSAPSYMAYVDVGMLVLGEHVFVHLERNSDKRNLLLLMIRKIYTLVKGKSNLKALML